MDNSFAVFVYIILIDILCENFTRLNVLFEDELFNAIVEGYLAVIVKIFFKHFTDIRSKVIINNNCFRQGF